MLIFFYLDLPQNFYKIIIIIMPLNQKKIKNYLQFNLYSEVNKIRDFKIYIYIYLVNKFI